MMKYIFSLIILLSSPAFGQTITDFTALNVQDGKAFSLKNMPSKNGVVVIFTSNVCPYSVYYEGRITQLVSDYGDRIQFILVNSMTDDKETAEQMKNKISTWGLSVPYLADKDGTISNQFGARKSPEVFLLKPVGGAYKVYYKGSIDNNPQVANDVKDQYLKKNIENLLAGKSAVANSTRPIGCMIR
ncbi:redoxin domain-containing protein [Fulvivirga lutea]|uniref:Redoxin domain-containing protein n=1 Tax=Fulvivirga lutea TaxID=2810512 RepID=A0A974WGP6_9BACT|nr:redoxin domain-containing protein [Fulvivirga lutea]QSE97740.1 redoxin domain-containing protein [Fulvivirga lutea]